LQPYAASLHGLARTAQYEYRIQLKLNWRRILAFTFERIKAGDPVQSTQDYKRAVEIGYGLPNSKRVVDVERDISLYCISVNSNDERPPGKYLLFYKSSLVVIHAYENFKRVSAESVITVFSVVSIDLPIELQGKANDLHDLIVEAMNAFGLNGVIPPVQVIVEFQNC
jgi:hypothetical protein